MRITGRLFFALVLFLCLGACFDSPHFPATPEIVYNNIQFKKGTPSPTDTLILTINFQDGDGDLGLDPADDSTFAYANRYYFTYTDSGKLAYITYKTKRTVQRYDTLPAYVDPYICTNWEIIYDTKGAPIDTLYFQLNPNYYNIFVDIYVQQPDGVTFKKFDWLAAYPGSCLVGGLDGRFPILSKDLSRATVQEGKIRYNMPSAGWLVTFSIKPLYLSVYIQDRALHKSNVIKTPVFTLLQ